MALASTPLPVHRLDAGRYAQIVDSGALDAARVELIDGIITDMSPQSAEHNAILRRLTAHFAACQDRLLIQMSLRVASDSVPEPDLAVVAEAPDPHAHPTTALLVVEVSLSPREIDRGRKSALYAAAKIGEYWIVDVDARTVDRRTHPESGRYGNARIHGAHDPIPSPVVGVADLDPADLFRGF